MLQLHQLSHGVLLVVVLLMHTSAANGQWGHLSGTITLNGDGKNTKDLSFSPKNQTRSKSQRNPSSLMAHSWPCRVTSWERTVCI